MANTRKPKTLAEITQRAKPVDVVVPVCVSGDLITEHQRIDRELDEMQANDDLRETPKLNGAGGKAQRDKMAKRLRQLEDEIRENTHDFVFRKLEKRTWFELMDEHPPRKGRERMERWNPDTFAPAAVQACCVAPEGMDNDETFRQFWDVALNDGQRAELFAGAQRANEDSLAVPFSVSASEHLSNSRQNSTT